MKISSYEPHHLAGIDALWRECFPDDPPRNSAANSIPEKLAIGEPLGRELLLVAEDAAGTVCGTVMAGYDGHRGWLYAVAVSPSIQRIGLGTQLVEEAINQLRKLGCNKVNLQIRSGNEKVEAFYRKLGFSVEPRTSMGREI